MVHARKVCIGKRLTEMPPSLSPKSSPDRTNLDRPQSVCLSVPALLKGYLQPLLHLSAPLASLKSCPYFCYYLCFVCSWVL